MKHSEQKAVSKPDLRMDPLEVRLIHWCFDMTGGGMNEMITNPRPC